MRLRGDDIILSDKDQVESYIVCTKNSAVELYFDASKKLETSSTGVTVTGTLAATNTNITTQMFMPDNGEIRLGDSDDLKLYHDGANSYFANSTGATLITGSGAGNIAIKPNPSEDSIVAVPNGSVQLYHNGSKKLETTALGISMGDTGNNGGLSELIKLGNDSSGSGTGCQINMGAASGNSSTSGCIAGFFDGTGTAVSILTSSAYASSGAVERFRVDSSGNTLVNCTSDPLSHNSKFIVQHGGDGQSVASFDFNQNFARPNLFIKHARAGAVSGTRIATMIAFLNLSGTEVGTIQSGLAGTSYNTSSDYRLKENITNISDGITRIKQLIPKKFNFIGDGDKTIKDGFLAHEVSSVVPEAITGTKDEVDSDNNPVYQGIDHSKLVPLLVAAVQELIGKVEGLETEVAALKVS